MLSPYVIARQAIYWKFPDEATRLAYVAAPNEITKIAWQEDDDTLWMLKMNPNTWIVFGSAPVVLSEAGIFSNLISADTTIAANTTKVVPLYLDVEATLTIDGSLLIVD